MEEGPNSSRGMETREQISEADIDLNKPNKDMRPKQNKIVEFKVGGVNQVGKVTQVGKATGKDRNRCWMRLRNGENKDERFDFFTDVQTWKVVKKVTYYCK